MKNLFFTLLFICQCIKPYAQTFFKQKNYPANFSSPVKFPVQLVGNFGECRPNHFHSGLDVRTDAKENKPIYSIERGFVSRVKIEPGGFGNAIFITHPGGYTSVYAHLNKFYPQLEAYVRTKQYETESWKQDLYFLPHQFPVSKQSFIAWSGNTGSSQGPHLHMEIRDSKTEAPLNGLLFYPTLKDTKSPIIRKLAVYDGSKSIYSQSPQLLNVTANAYTSKLNSDLVQVQSDKVYFGVVADDYMDISTGTLGIFEMRMYVDEKPFFAWQMDHISYDVTRYMNAIADYKVKKNNGPWIQLCRALPNDKLEVYKAFTKDNGLIEIKPNEKKRIRIEIYDTKYNKNALNFEIIGTTVSSKETCAIHVKAGTDFSHKTNDIQLNWGTKTLYDDVCLSLDVKNSALPYSHQYQLHFAYVPIHDQVSVSLKPKVAIPEILASKVALVKLPSGTETKKKGISASLLKGMVYANIKEFGTYEIVLDEKGPLITSTQNGIVDISKLKRILVTIKDDVTSIKSAKATVNNKWLRLVQKGDTFYYELDEHFPAGTHVIKIEAEDLNSNKSNFQLSVKK